MTTETATEPRSIAAILAETRAQMDDTDPIRTWKIDSAANAASVGLSDLMNRPEVTDAEREQIREAWYILNTVNLSISRRLHPEWFVNHDAVVAALAAE